MLSSVGRPREHDQLTAAALLAAGERAVAHGGLEALSVRGVAAEAATTTRAVYSLFGSRDGLIAALGAHTYDLLRTALERLPQTADPQADMVEAGLMFRRFALEHPALFSIGIQRTLTSSELWPQFRAAANDALAVLSRRLARLQEKTCSPGEPCATRQPSFTPYAKGSQPSSYAKRSPPRRRTHLARRAHGAHRRPGITPPRLPPEPTIPARRPMKHDPT